MASRSFNDKAGFAAWFTDVYYLPRYCKHIIRIKDHKEYLVPSGHEPNKNGWID